MGGWMTYGRMRNRNGLSWRGSDVQLYPGDAQSDDAAVRAGRGGLVGDLNRMERDYLVPPAELSRRCGDPDPSTEASMATGVDVETVRTVLTYVFTGSR